MQHHQQWSVYDSVFVYDASSAPTPLTATTTATTTSTATASHHHYPHHQHHQHQQLQGGRGRHLSRYRLSRVVLLDVLVGLFDELQVSELANESFITHYYSMHF